ncbi:MAG: SurA N-terminal domain-containing protein [Nitrospirae bacterium]|nr:SurA N-terminal domain-containing protein [Nitrospirota bacterium]
MSYAETIDGVAAYVDDSAITISEFRAAYLKMREDVVKMTEQEVLDSMINRQLLLNAAKKIRFGALTDDVALKEYVDIKIRASVLISEEDVRGYYNKHAAKFKDGDYLSVRDDIERHLFEVETNRLLKAHIEELRGNSEVRVNVKEKIE